MNIYPKLPKQWITSSLNPDKIRGQPVRIQLKGGQIKQETFEIEEANDKGQILVRVDYNSSLQAGTVSFVSFRVSQEQLDSWMADRDVVLKVP
jgi:hypothetical protein